MKKIGVLARPKEDSERLFWTLNDEIKEVILSYGYLPYVIVPPTDYKNPLSDAWKNILTTQLEECVGVILQGGNQICEYDKYVLSYLKEHDIPTLGICLGMQTMADGQIEYMEEEKVKLHHDHPKEKYVHDVWIQPGTRLFEIVKQLQIPVNSRHHDQVIHTDLLISAYSKDGVVEAIEDSTKTFYIGVQWHPESMVAYDTVSRLLFDSFFKTIGGSYETNRNSEDRKGDDRKGV